jgi:hypothetical protein
MCTTMIDALASESHPITTTPHYVARLSKLLSAAPILRTSEQNQNVLTTERIGVIGGGPRELCRVVAVTAEKNVAIVDILRTLS